MNATINISDYTARQLNSILRKLCGSPKNGRSRKVYIDKTNRIVYKLPVISSAKMHNAQEYNNYLDCINGNSAVIVAECELQQTADGIDILIMEYVNTKAFKFTWDMPEWARGGTLDSYQLGINDRGQAVAYDHTYPI